MSADEPGGEVLPFPSAQVVDDDDTKALLPALEALLFAAGAPVTLRQIADALEEPSPRRIERGLRLLAARLDGSHRGLDLVEVGGGWQLRTDPRFSGPILRLLGATAARLSKASLETLAVIAYRQPVTRAEVEELRGVSSGPVLRSLIDRGLVRVTGRQDVPGRPLQYGTTATFLEVFGLRDLAAMPTLADRQDLDTE